MFLSLLLASSGAAGETETKEPDYIAEYGAYIEDVAGEYGISPELIEAVIYYESSGDPECHSEAGAVGLMQIIPKHHRERMERLGVSDLTDPYDNILVGTDIIAELAEEYEAYDALAAYNCGEYSQTFKKVLAGEKTWSYSEKILTMATELERQHGK